MATRLLKPIAEIFTDSAKVGSIRRGRQFDVIKDEFFGK